MPYLKLINEIRRTAGPSGFERKCIEFLKQTVEDTGKAEQVWIDKAGNLICHKKGKGKPIVFVTTVDIGGIYVHTLEDENSGYLNLLKGIATSKLINETIRMEGKNGYVTIVSSSLWKKTDQITAGDLIIKSDERINVGDYGVIENKTAPIQKDNIITANDLEHLLGIIVLIELIGSLADTETEVYCVFAVNSQEGSIGATAALYALDPMALVKISGCKVNDIEKTKEQPGPVLYCNAPFAVYNIENISKISNELESKQVKFMRACRPVNFETISTTPMFEQSVAGNNTAMYDIAVPFSGIVDAEESFSINDVKETVKLLKTIITLYDIAQ